MDPLSRMVDEILADLSRKKGVAEATVRLKGLGSRAIPRLLHHLEQSERPIKTLCFYGLQFCWSRGAGLAVTPYLAHEDAELRRMAAIVLVKGEGYGALLAALRPLLHHPNGEVVAFALEYVEAEEPDLERFLACFPDPLFRPVLTRHLPRYHDPRLTPATLELLRQGGRETWLPGVAGLIRQQAKDPGAREAIFHLLVSPDPAAREVAGEYLAWHGLDSDLGVLEEAMGREGDPHAHASLRAAVQAVYRRKQRKTLTHYHEFEPGEWEPVWAYRGRDAPAGYAHREGAWRRYLSAHLAFPHGETVAGGVEPDFCQGPLLPPVRDYFDPDRHTFGHEVEETAVKGFGGLIHVGDDLHWHAPHRTVVAIGPGRVRLATHLSTWGYMVVVEHRRRDGLAFCSLYAHLSPFLAVREGENVCRGDKIGSIGRAYTWENGGYEAHLHFGIHWGPFHQIPRPGVRVDVRHLGHLQRGRVVAANGDWTAVELVDLFSRKMVRKATSWTVGYLSREGWEEGGDGWEDPQLFLQTYA